VGMMDARGHLGLALEPGELAGRFRTEELEGDPALELRVPGLPDLPHAAAAEQRDLDVLADAVGVVRRRGLGVGRKRGGLRQVHGGREDAALHLDLGEVAALDEDRAQRRPRSRPFDDALAELLQAGVDAVLRAESGPDEELGIAELLREGSDDPTVARRFFHADREYNKK